MLDLKDKNFIYQCLLNCDRVLGKIPLIRSRTLLFLEISAIDKRIICSIHQGDHFHPLTSVHSSSPPPHQHKGHKPKRHAPKSAYHLKSERNRLSPRILGAIISASAICVLSVIFVAVLFCCMRKNQQNPRVEISSPAQKKISVFNPIGVPLTYENIVQATGNFSQTMCIGNGGFGVTYRADISPGNTVAVKRLTAERHPRRSTVSCGNQNPWSNQTSESYYFDRVLFQRRLDVLDI